MRKLFVASVGMLALIGLTAAVAKPAFISADKNSDGSLSFSELTFFEDAASEMHFVAADRDNNGALSRSEFNILTGRS